MMRHFVELFFATSDRVHKKDMGYKYNSAPASSRAKIDNTLENTLFSTKSFELRYGLNAPPAVLVEKASGKQDFQHLMPPKKTEKMDAQSYLDSMAAKDAYNSYGYKFF